MAFSLLVGWAGFPPSVWLSGDGVVLTSVFDFDVVVVGLGVVVDVVVVGLIQDVGSELVLGCVILLTVT